MDNSRPEPDLAVAKGGADDFPEPPSGEQILLAIEIAETSSKRTLRKKGKAVRPERGGRALGVDVQERRIELHREASERGDKVVTILAETEPFAPLFLPKASLKGSDILPRLVDEGTRSV